MDGVIYSGKDLIPGSDITVGDTITPEDEIELRYRGRISIANATEQLGWQPRYRQVADGLAQYVDAYQRFIDSTERPNQ